MASFDYSPFVSQIGNIGNLLSEGDWVGAATAAAATYAAIEAAKANQKIIAEGPTTVNATFADFRRISPIAILLIAAIGLVLFLRFAK